MALMILISFVSSIALLSAIASADLGEYRLIPRADLFVASTFQGCAVGCSKDTPDYSTDLYRSCVKKQCKCIGKYCNGSEWDCYDHTYGCYHAMHLIHEMGPEFEDCPKCKNIGSNYVMAYGKWNAAMKNKVGQRYDVALDERIRVFEIALIERARTAIQACCGGDPATHIYVRTMKVVANDSIGDHSDDFLMYGPENSTDSSSSSDTKVGAIGSPNRDDCINCVDCAACEEYIYINRGYSEPANNGEDIAAIAVLAVFLFIALFFVGGLIMAVVNKMRKAPAASKGSAFENLSAAVKQVVFSIDPK